MEMMPPYGQPVVSIEDQGWILNTTYVAVVLAADGVGGARIAGADADDGDGGAGKPHEGVHVLHDDAQ